MIKIDIPNLQALPGVAKEFLDKTQGHTIFAFYGSMGAGKTTLIKALCQALKVEDTINSPSFAIVNEYHTPTDDIVFHFDFYRIKNMEEAFDFGYEDYFFSGHLCLIEWPEKIEPLLPDDHVPVNILVNEDGSRTLEIHL